MTPVAISIGDIVAVFCDHKKSGRRVRDWVDGVVVHADDRMTAIQFRNDVYLTDGWMVPDRILWFNKGTDKIRLVKKARSTAASGKAKKPSVRRKKKPVRKTVKKTAAKKRKPKPSRLKKAASRKKSKRSRK
jgi:hypothetical protein